LNLEHVDHIPPLDLLQHNIRQLLSGHSTESGRLTISTLLHIVEVLLRDTKTKRPLIEISLDVEFITALCNAMLTNLSTFTALEKSSHSNKRQAVNELAIIIDILLQAPFLLHELLTQVSNKTIDKQSQAAAFHTMIFLVGNDKLRQQIQAKKEMVINAYRRITECHELDSEAIQLKATLESHMRYLNN